MYIYRLIEGNSAKDAFKKMLQREQEYYSNTNEISLFLNFKRYQIININLENEPIKDLNVIKKHIKEHKFSQRCCALIILNNNMYQFVLPYEIEYE
jgi:hypothetical protein